MKFLKNNDILDIEEANEGDAKGLSLFLKKVKEESNFIVLSDNGLSKTDQELHQYLLELKDHLTSKLFIGKVSGSIVASGGIYHRETSIEGNVVLDINVLNDYLGIAAEAYILNHVINYARITAEIKSIDILAIEGQDLIDLYKKLGFYKISHQKEDVALKPDKSEVVYRLDI